VTFNGMRVFVVGSYSSTKFFEYFGHRDVGTFLVNSDNVITASVATNTHTLKNTANSGGFRYIAFVKPLL